MSAHRKPWTWTRRGRLAVRAVQITTTSAVALAVLAAVSIDDPEAARVDGTPDCVTADTAWMHEGIPACPAEVVLDVRPQSAEPAQAPAEASPAPSSPAPAPEAAEPASGPAEAGAAAAPPAPAPAPARCFEDELCWDSRTMGNREAGVQVEGDWYVISFDEAGKPTAVRER